ncbi:MAG: glycosyltransferase family 4 protein [Phycisphaerales bacterium]
MIALTDPDDPNQVSGMPHRMAQALRAQGIRITPIIARSPSDDARHPILDRIARAHRRRSPSAAKRFIDNTFPRSSTRSLHARSRSLAASVRSQLDELNTPAAHANGDTPDLLFGVCIATALAQLDTNLPIVYFSDATSRVINTTYPAYAGRGKSIQDTRELIERSALERVTHAVFAAPFTRDSAVNDFGIPIEHTTIIPMGAHVTPAEPSSITPPADAPTKNSCRLLIIAADPKRKRVDLAVKATETLRRLGVNATLSVVGPGTRLARRSKAVDFVSSLRLSSTDDARKHRELLRTAHIQLLPSLGEAFGIAPAESAHFARPSIVSDAGGLPSVVLNDQTGLVLPVAADHRDWAQAVAKLVADPDRYRRYSTAALARARTELTWSAWATGMVSLMQRTLDQHSITDPTNIANEAQQTITPPGMAG